MRTLSRIPDVPKEFAEAAGPHPTHPYHGYYFRVLKQQGPNAPGGPHSYVMGKTMIGGIRSGRLAGQLRRHRRSHLHRESRMA